MEMVVLNRRPDSSFIGMEGSQRAQFAVNWEIEPEIW